LAPGVSFDWMVGAHNQARRLTTGYARFEPAARLPYHTHEYSESITLLAGSAAVEVEGRRYALERLDNIVVPLRTAHAVVNASPEAAVLHVAMPSEAPTRALVEESFDVRIMSPGATAPPGKERLTRFGQAARTAAGPNTEFIDYFNSELVPGIEMSGGYGLFHPGGRLPAHFHDFDESIAIIRGEAACIVEGRRYKMADYATALQPRGRVHYFINESSAPMEMIWVYAGPQPQRIVVDPRCATTEGNPWK
jgi:quercetin dioxygenase-like cupin family protein